MGCIIFFLALTIYSFIARYYKIFIAGRDEQATIIYTWACSSSGLWISYKKEIREQALPEDWPRVHNHQLVVKSVKMCMHDDFMCSCAGFTTLLNFFLAYLFCYSIIVAVVVAVEEASIHYLSVVLLNPQFIRWNKVLHRRRILFHLSPGVACPKFFFVFYSMSQTRVRPQYTIISSGHIWI